jgi:hypothetical protein
MGVDKDKHVRESPGGVSSIKHQPILAAPNVAYCCGCRVTGTIFRCGNEERIAFARTVNQREFVGSHVPLSERIGVSASTAVIDT